MWLLAHGPVEEPVGEMLTPFAKDVPTYVCIDANGRLGSSTSEHVGSMAADEETPNGEWLHRFLVGANLCSCERCDFVKETALLGCRQGRDRDALILWLCPSQKW